MLQLLLSYAHADGQEARSSRSLYRRSLAIREQKLGADHPNTVTVRRNFELLREEMRGDREMGRWGDGEMGRWGDGEIGVCGEAIAGIVYDQGNESTEWRSSRNSGRKALRLLLQS